MAKTKIFISFDYDNDLDIKMNLIAHTAPLFTTVCPDERHVRGYEMAL